MSDEEKDLLDVVIDDPKTDDKKDDPVVIVEGEDKKASEDTDNLTDEKDPEKVIKKLERKLKKEKEAREKAEYQASLAQQQVKKTFVSDHETKTQLVASAIEKIKTDNSILTSQLAEAMASNDAGRVAEINMTMASNAAKLTQLETGYEDMKRNPPRAPQISEIQASGSALDQIIENVSDKSAKWLKQNRDHLNDDKAIRRMFRAHEDAIDDGIKPDTREYFQYIENRLGIGKVTEKDDDGDDEDTPMSAASKPAKSIQPSPAPVERGSTRSNVVRLTRAEVETAQMLGMTEKEYAQHKLALQKQGKLPN